MKKGPAPKNADLQRRNKPAQFTVVPFQSRTEPPKCPRGFLRATRDRWKAFWEDEVSKTVTPAQYPGLERLFSLYDERERAYRDYRKNRLVEGSKNQTVLNPLGRLMVDFDKEARQLEDRYGLNPGAYMKLGIDTQAAIKSLEDRNRALASDTHALEDPRQPRGEVADPRA